MDSAKPVGSSPTYFNYYEITKATVTSVALMVLSVGVMKGIERYAKRTITPLQRNIAGVLLTSVYLVIPARLFGPFTKKNDPPPSDPHPSSNTTVADLHGSGSEVRVRDQEVHAIDLPSSHLSSPDGLFQGDPDIASKLPTQPDVSRLSLPSPHRDEERRDLPRDREVLTSLTHDLGSLEEDSRLHFPSGSLDGERDIPSRLLPPQVGQERHSMSLFLDLSGPGDLEEHAGLPALSPSSLHEEDRGSGSAMEVVPRREKRGHRERQRPLLGPQELIRNPIDLTRVDPRKIKVALRVFQQAIINNGFRAIGCAIPLDGRVVLIQVDISTRQKQLEALRLCKQWQMFFDGGQRDLLPPTQSGSLPRIFELPDSGRLGAPLVRRVEDARPLRGLDDSGFELVEDPARPDESMVVRAAPYDEDIHGVNGYRMKQKLYSALFGEYARLLQEKMKVDPMTKLQQIEQVSYCWRSREDHLLMWVLHYLLREGQQGYHVMVTGEEARYWDFIQAHEALMSDYQGKEETYNADVLAWSRAIAEVRMTPRIQSYQESLVAAHYQGLPVMTAKSFHQAFAMRNEELRRVDSRMKLWSVWSETSKLQGAISYCNYFGMNPPNLRKVERWRTEAGESREIFYLRHSTPHSGATVGKAPVDLTYREFLRSAQDQGHGVIYAIHQRLDDYGVKFEQEGYRVQSILDLEGDHPNFLPLVQSVESDLFKHGRATFAELKEAILDSFIHKKGARRNRLPRFLVEDGGETLVIKPAYKAELIRIFDFVKRVFFPSEIDRIDQSKVDYYGGLTDQAHLTSESQAFIMLFYHFQREHLKFADLRAYGYDYQVKYVNSGCKDDYDRGGGQNGTSDRVHQHQVFGTDVPQPDLEATLSSIQAPPIQGKGIPAIKYRLHPALLVSSMLANLGERQLQELQAVRWNGWSLASYDVGRRGGQTAV